MLVVLLLLHASATARAPLLTDQVIETLREREEKPAMVLALNEVSTLPRAHWRPAAARACSQYKQRSQTVSTPALCGICRARSCVLRPKSFQCLQPSRTVMLTPDHFTDLNTCASLPPSWETCTPTLGCGTRRLLPGGTRWTHCWAPTRCVGGGISTRQGRHRRVLKQASPALGEPWTIHAGYVKLRWLHNTNPQILEADTGSIQEPAYKRTLYTTLTLHRCDGRRSRLPRHGCLLAAPTSPTQCVHMPPPTQHHPQAAATWRASLGHQTPDQLLKSYGAHGLLLGGATLCGKLLRFRLAHKDLSLHASAARLAAHLLAGVFCCDVAHPQRASGFALHAPEEIWPGADLFGGGDAYRWAAGFFWGGGRRVCAGRYGIRG